jgi:hypothetical protein
MRLRDALRHILLGGLIAAGMGSLSMAVITAWLGLPSQAIPAGGAAGSAAYLVGVFGPAFIEVVLARLRSGKGGTPMHELLRLARAIRCDAADPGTGLQPPPAHRPSGRRADPDPFLHLRVIPCT